MSYPDELLGSGESVVADFRPHWSRVLRELIILVAAIVIVVAATVLFAGAVQWWSYVVVGVFAISFTLPNIVRWRFSQYVITNERVISRSGVISREGIEIPLEVINNVAFTQTVFERIFRTGDVLIESAGEHGQNRFTDVPHPEKMQTLMYRIREERMRDLQSAGGVPEAAASTVAEQLAILSDLHDQGKLSDEEFAAQKARLLGE